LEKSNYSFKVGDIVVRKHTPATKYKVIEVLSEDLAYGSTSGRFDVPFVLLTTKDYILEPEAARYKAVRNSLRDDLKGE